MTFGDVGHAHHTSGAGAGPGLMRTYSRTLGVIQMAYASFFGRCALGCLDWAAEQLMSIARDGFSFKGRILKGEYAPALDARNLAEGVILALLALAGLVGGCGLIGLRPWARRWEIAYLILVSACAMAVLAVEAGRGHDLGYIAIVYAIFTLPCLPFVLTSPRPDEPRPPGSGGEIGAVGVPTP